MDPLHRLTQLAHTGSSCHGSWRVRVHRPDINDTYLDVRINSDAARTIRRALQHDLIDLDEVTILTKLDAHGHTPLEAFVVSLPPRTQLAWEGVTDIQPGPSPCHANVLFAKLHQQLVVVKTAIHLPPDVLAQLTLVDTSSVMDELEAYYDELAMYERLKDLQGGVIPHLLYVTTATHPTLKARAFLTPYIGPTWANIHGEAALHRNILRHLLQALSILHRRNLVHGDIHDENVCVVLDASGTAVERVVLIDLSTVQAVGAASGWVATMEFDVGAALRAYVERCPRDEHDPDWLNPLWSARISAEEMALRIPH